MLFITLLALEQPMTIVTSLPGHFRALGRKPTTLACIRAPVIFVIILCFLARMAIVNVGEKARHLGDDVIMVVVHVQVNLLVFLWTSIDDFIAVFFRDDTDLIILQFRTDQGARPHFGGVLVPNASASACDDLVFDGLVGRYQALL